MQFAGGYARTCILGINLLCARDALLEEDLSEAVGHLVRDSCALGKCSSHSLAREFLGHHTLDELPRVRLSDLELGIGKESTLARDVEDIEARIGWQLG